MKNAEKVADKLVTQGYLRTPMQTCKEMGATRAELEAVLKSRGIESIKAAVARSHELLVRQAIEDANTSPEFFFFCRWIGYVTAHRLCKKITGLPPATYIKAKLAKRAAQEQASASAGSGDIEFVFD